MIVEFQPGSFEIEQSLRDAQYSEQKAPNRDSFILDLNLMCADEAERNLALAAFEYGALLDYTERGSVAGGYFMHPVRVARLLAGFRDTIDGSAVVCALLHNVLETAHPDIDTLERVAGSDVLTKIRALTIDRQHQPDPVYLAAYYDGIRSAGAGDVKVVDKIDNLFLLHVEPNAAIRRRYIEEIRVFVVPLCRSCLPGATGYLENLVDYVVAREQRGAT